MSLNVRLEVTVYGNPISVFDCNITSNLVEMAEAAGIHKHIWLPKKINIETARELIEPLAAGLELLESSPEHFSQWDDPDGWGTHKDFVLFVRQYLDACKKFPSATVGAWS